MCMDGRAYVHKVVLEEIFQLSLSGRVGEVSDVQSPSLSGTGDDGLVLRRVDWFTASSDAGSFCSAGRLVEGGVGHLGGG